MRGRRIKKVKQLEDFLGSKNHKIEIMEYHTKEERDIANALHLASLKGREICCRGCDRVTPLEQLGTLDDDDYGICDRCAGRRKK